METAIFEKRGMQTPKIKGDFEHNVLRILDSIDNRLWSIETEISELWEGRELREDYVGEIEQIKKEKGIGFSSIDELRKYIESEDEL